MTPSMNPSARTFRTRIAKPLAIGLSTGLVTLALTTAPAAADTTAPPTRPALQKQADAIVAAGVPGVGVQVRDEDGTWNGVSGVGNARTGSSPRSGRVFRIGSVTKTFTATMVLQLVAEGRVELDTPIGRYLPGLLPYRRPITVRQLLQHRSGLFEYGKVVWPNPRAVSDRRFRHYEPRQLIGTATRHPLQFKPGSKFSYSNTDYIILGMLIEKVTRHSIDTELWHRIVRPAGLTHTYLAGDFPFLLNPALRGYETLGSPKGPLTDLSTYNMSVSWASGAAVSTATDLNRFYRALLDGTLLASAELRQMKRTVPAFPGFGYGLGLAGAKPCGQRIWGHVGGAPGYLTYSFTDAAADRQITITINRSLTVPARAEKAITAMVMSEFCGDLS